MPNSSPAEQVALVVGIATDPIARRKFVDDPVAFGLGRDVALDPELATEAARRFKEAQESIDTLGGKSFSESQAQLRPAFLIGILAVVAAVTAVVDAATHVYHALTHAKQ